MKAAVCEKINAPWVLKELPDPEPKAGQVVIKIQAAGLCGTDIHLKHGLLPVKLPLVPGHEPVGEVVKVGPGVTSIKVGDRVGVSWNQKGCGRCLFCQEEKDKYCLTPGGLQTWMNLGGGFSEYMIAYEEGCTIIPEKLSSELAAPLFCAGFTIASGYYNANPKPGERIAVIGVGGLGHLAVQYAKAKGHFVIAIVRSEDKIALSKELGADEVIVAKDGIGKALKRMGGADIILNTGNSSDFASDAVAGMRPEGRLVNMGIDTQPLKINAFNLLLSQGSIKGSQQNNRSDLIDILNLTALGKVKPMIEVYSLDEINTVLDRLAEGKVRFRAVIKF
ncbi:MAG: alcohol dehydrogenase catalytic domain-containing protein [Parachlamydiaceae bacterium]